jgi:hypothetical protein
MVLRVCLSSCYSCESSLHGSSLQSFPSLPFPSLHFIIIIFSNNDAHEAPSNADFDLIFHRFAPPNLFLYHRAFY